MKRKVKRISKSSLSVVLTLCMLFSCFTAAFVVTDAATVDSASTGATWHDNVNLHLYKSGTSDEQWTAMSTMNTHYTINFGSLGRTGLCIQIKADGDSQEYWLYSENGEVSGNIGNGFTNKWWKPNQNESVVNFDDNCDYEIWWNQSDSSHGIQLNVQKVQGNQIWTVCGSDANLFGSTWNTGSSSDTANDMVWDESTSTYVKEYDNYVATGSSFNYKIVRDHGWATSVPSGSDNQTCNVTNGTRYKVKFVYTPSTGVLTCNLTEYCQIEAYITNDYTLRVSGTKNITNISGSNTDYYLKGSTATVKVIPADNTKKVTAISAGDNSSTLSSITQMSSGAYKATFTVNSSATGAKAVSATLANKQNVTVNFSGTNGTVTAVTEDGTTLTSGDTVLEGTKVTFTATPNDGYVLTGWTGLTDAGKKTVVTQTITANTTVSASFGKEGYKLVPKNGTAYGMTALSNGWYISGALTNNATFTILRNSDGKYVQANSNSSGGLYWFSDLNSHKDVSDKWVSSGSQPTADRWFYYYHKDNTTLSTAYLVYDPVNDEIWLTSTDDGIYDITIYVKDGTIRGSDSGTSANWGTSSVTGVSNNSYITNDHANNYFNNHVIKIEIPASAVRSNEKTITITTTVNSAYQSNWYVAGFDVNGGVSQGVIAQEYGDDFNELLRSNYGDQDAYDKIHTSHSNSFTLDLSKYPDNVIEITPIYFPIHSNSSEFIRFYAEKFAGDVKEAWGGALACYPYIQNTHNFYGTYPGQLMINQDGVYYADISAKYNNTAVQGMTMSNYVFDDVHWGLFYAPKLNNDWSDSTRSANQHQTYDYSEFAVIYEILQTKEDSQHNHYLEDEDIIFSFEYKGTSTLADSNLGQSTYYRDSDNADPTREYDYRNGYETIDPDEQWGWFNFTDYYGNRIDIFGDSVDIEGNDKASATNPVRIVSNGYDWNATGYYATAWAFYVPMDASGNPAWTDNYDHYELVEVIGGQGKSSHQSESFVIDPDNQDQVRMKYDQSYYNKYHGQSGHATSSFIFDLAGRPTVISMEYEIFNNRNNLGTSPDNQPAYRSDGRWYYSDPNQLIHAHTIIEYSNTKTNPIWVRDYYQPNNYDYTDDEHYDATLNAGRVTGVTANFTNENTVEKDSHTFTNVPGYTEAYALSNGKCTYELTTSEDPDGVYEFVGWYLKTGDDPTQYPEVDLNNKTISVTANTNAVYVARYVKVPAGTLNITHSVKEGSGKTYLKVEVYTNSSCTGTPVETLGGDIDLGSGNTGFTDENINIKKYIKKGSNYYLKVYLSNEASPGYTFNQFWDKVDRNDIEALSSINKAFIITPSISGNMATMIVSVDGLFNNDDEQTVKSLPFYSDFTAQTKTLTITKIVDAADTNETTFPIKVQYWDDEANDGQDGYVDLSDAPLKIGSSSGTSDVLSPTGTYNISAGAANKLIIDLVGGRSIAKIKVTETLPSGTVYNAAKTTMSLTNGTETVNTGTTIEFNQSNQADSEVTINNYKPRTLTITKSADTSTSETFDFYVYKWDASLSTPAYVLIETDPGFTYSGSGSFSNSTHKLTLAKDATASLTVYTGEKYKVVEVPKSGSTFAFSRTGSGVTDGTTAISTVGEVDDSTNGEYGYDNIVINNDTTAVTIRNNQIKNDVKVTKTTNADADYTTDFKVRVQFSTDGGSSFTDLQALTLNVTHYDNSTGTVAVEAITGGYQYAIKKGDVITVPDVVKGTIVRIIESDYVSDYYTFGGITSGNVTLTNVAGNNYAKQFTMGTADVNITVSNEFIPQTIRVTKKIYKKNGDNFSDYEYNDGSKFTMHVDLNPHGSGANYDPLGTGLVSVNGTGTATAPTGDGATAAAAGNYVVEKDGYIQFNNIPKGSRVEIQETAVGISPITGEQRFTTKELVQSAQATDSSATNLATGYITVNSDLNLVQRNIVKQNDVEIKKTTDSVDTTVDHTIHINAWDNGKPNHMYDGTTPHTATAAISTINYTRSTLGGTTTTESTSNGNITIHHGDTITLHYPVGTYYEITETAGTLYSYYNVSADTPDMASSTGGVNVPAPSVNTATGEVKFQTKDAKPEITYINNRNEYTYTIKKQTDINNTTDQFKIKVWVKDSASESEWTQYTQTIGTTYTANTSVATTDPHYGEYTITKGAQLTITGRKANSLIKVEESSYDTNKYTGSIAADGTDSDFQTVSGSVAGYTVINANKGAVITNNVKTTTVTINKSVTGGATGRFTEFPLTVKITNEVTGSTATYSYTSSGYTGDATHVAHTGSVTNGTANSNVKIWGTETLTFTGVPVGATVEVTEGTMPTGYSCTSIGATGGANVTFNTKPNVTFKTTGSATAAVAIVNAVATHNVTITKAISNSNNSTEEFSISASIKPDGADDTAVTTWTRSIASAASASGSLSGMAIKNGESIVLENVPEGAEITVSEAAETDFTCQSIVAMDGNSTVIASANASTLTFTVPSSNATVTVTNKINDKTVTIHKVTDTATTGKSFKIKAQYTPTNINTLTDYTSDSFSAGYATLGKDDTATVTVPKDASVTITELTGSDMPSGYEFEKITVDTTTATAQNNGYTYTEQTDEDIYVHNTELHSVNLYKTTDNIGTTDTFTFKVYKWDTNASPNAWVQVDGDYTITANDAATATTTKFRKDTLIKVVETPVTSGKYTYDHSGSSVTNAADTSYSRPSGENGFENIKMGTSDVNVTLNNTVNTKTVKISKTADYTETTAGAFTFNVKTQEEGVASAANCTYKYKLNGTGSELDFTDGNVTLASGQFIEIYNVPVDTVVTVQETNAGQATSTTAVISNEKASTGSYNPETKTAAFTVGTSADPEVQFTNSKTKTLTITKTTDIADTSENFYIKVEKYDTSTSQYVAFDGSYSGPENRLNGGKFTIHHGESISISVNTNEQYRVYETDIPLYYTLASVTPTGASSATAYPASGTQTGSDVTIGESNVTVAFVNNIAKHDVTIKKVVSNLTTADTFPISVTLNDPTTDSSVHNQYTCTYDGTNTPWGSATITDGTAQTFTVAQDKTITIKDVPYGTTVTVNEVPAARYNCTGITVTGAADAGTQSGTDANRTLVFTTADAQADVTVTNAVKLQNLTITKTVTNSAKNDDNFPITITIKPDGSSGSIQAQWVYTDSTLTTQNTDPQNLPTTIKNGQSYVISNVPVGAEVSVSEDDISSTDYSFSEIVVSPTVTETTGTQSKTFEMPVEDETVTIKNTINNKTVTVKKIVDDGSGTFPILVEVKNSNANDFSNFSGTGFTDGKVDIESGSAGVQISVPLDAEVRVSELTADIPTGYQFSKFTKQIGSADPTDETAANVTDGSSTVIGKSYTYTGATDATITVHNLKVQNGLTIRKICDDGDPGSSTFRILVTYRRQSDSSDQTSYVDVANGGSEVINLPYGTIIKEVTETPVTGYVLDRITKGAADTEAFALFTLLGSETITVHNRLTKHTVTIVKEVVDESGTSIADSQNFGVSVQQGSSAATNHTFSKGHPVTLNNVPYGTVVTATESASLPRGYEFVSYSANNGQAITGDTTITVTNMKLNTHEVKIEKNVDVDSGSQTFAINIDPNADCTYQVYDSSGTAKTGTGTSGSLTAATNATVSLMKDEYVIVSGLYRDESITVNETDEGSPTYEFVKYTVIRGSTTSDISTKQYTYNVTNDAEQTIVVNNKNAVTTEYNIIYNFRSYRSLYDDMIYQTGEQSFTSAELINTVSSGDVKNMDGGTVESMRFKSMAALKSFIDRHAPYEDGFMEEITWITDKISGQDYTPDNITHTNDDLSNDGVMVNYNESGSLVTIVVNANQTTFTTANAIFKLPYDTVKDGTKDTFAPVRDGDGEVVKIDSYARAPYATTQAAIITYNGEKIVAPERVKNRSGGYDYFSYWQVSTLPTDIKLNNPSEPYTKCFSKEFNLVLYQDSIIEPVYLNTAPVTPHEEADKTGNNSKATITFMENSRTQWNDYPDSNHTKYPNDHNWDKGDRVYTDFLVSFAYNDIQLNTSTGRNYGIVIEEAGDLRNMDGWNPNVGTINYTQSDYANKFAGSSSADIQNFIHGSASSSGNLKRSEKSVSTLNNYNRTDFYYAMALMNQNYGKEGYGEYYEKHYKVYKAYSYLVTTSGRNVLLCSKPIYFTIYDMATISYQAPQTP